MNTASRVMLMTATLLCVLTASLFPLSAKEVRKMTMKLTSPEFTDGQKIPGKYSCNGDNINPPLAIDGVPAEAKSLAMIMDDPDAPGGTWVHWVIWNIDPTTKQIAAGSVPQGAQQGINSWHKSGYGGPCPPSGTHRYYFHLFALKERIELPSSAKKNDLERAMQGKILAESRLMGLYSHNGK